MNDLVRQALPSGIPVFAPNQDVPAGTYVSQFGGIFMSMSGAVTVTYDTGFSFDAPANIPFGIPAGVAEVTFDGDVLVAGFPVPIVSV